MRELIVREIQRIAAESGGRPPGVKLFASRTGIAEHKWRGSIWARWGDALAEAGFEPNTLQSRLESEAVLAAVAALAKRLGAVPTVAEMKLARRADPSFPNPKTVAAHFGNGRALVPHLRGLAERDPAHRHLLAFLPEAADGEPIERPKEKPAGPAGDGWVYLIRSADVAAFTRRRFQ